VYAWTNEGGTANIAYGVQTSPDGASWLPHTTATGAITAVGASKLEVTGFQKYLRLYYTESGTGTMDVNAALTFKRKVA
jgi:streptogramin lyase